MALVPLEERLQSKERAWEAERRDLVTRAEDSIRSMKAEGQERREIEKRVSEMEEERWECCCCGRAGALKTWFVVCCCS